MDPLTPDQQDAQDELLDQARTEGYNEGIDDAEDKTRDRIGTQCSCSSCKDFDELVDEIAKLKR